MNFLNKLFGNKNSNSIHKTVLDDNPSPSSSSNTISGLFEGAVRRSDDLTPEQAYRKIAPVRNAIDKIASSAARARIRFFTSNDEEIVGGSLYNLFQNPNKFQSQYEFSKELISWYLLTSEYSVLPIAINAATKPTGLRVLDPTHLYYSYPINPQSLEDIVSWRYCYYNGISVDISAGQLIYSKSFSPGCIRGISSIASGTNEINTYYQATRYTRNFFENDKTPNLHVKLPKGMGPENKEQFIEEWCNTFSVKRDGSHRTFFSDNDTEVDTIESTLKSSFDVDLIKLEQSMIYQIYSVPPIISGDWANAKYDSAAEQLEMFADNTLFPILRSLTDTFQVQLVDRYAPYWRQDIKIQKSAKVSRSVRKAIDIAKANDTVSSGIYIVWDIDTLPIAAKIQQSKLDAAIKLMNDGRTSKIDAFDFYDIDIPSSNPEADNAIFVPTNVIEYQSPAMLAAAQQAQTTQLTPVVDANPVDNTEPVDTAKSVTSDEEKSYSKKVSRFLMDYRILALKNQSIKLRDIDALLDKVCPNDSALKDETRIIFAQIKEINKSEQSPEDKVLAIKSIFNSISKQRIRDISKQYNDGVSQ